MGLNGKTVRRFQTEKEQKQNSQVFKYCQWNTRPPNATFEERLGNQTEINWRKIEKAFRLKLLKIWKTRNKKLSSNMIKFFDIFTGHDMAADAGRSTNCRQKVKAPWLPTKCSEKQELSKTWVSTGKQIEKFKQKKEQKQHSRQIKNNPQKTQPLKTRQSGKYCASDNSISLGLKRLLKTKVLKTKANFPVKKKIGLIFLSFSNMTNVRKQPTSVHKGFWQVLCELYDHLFRT